MDRHIEAIKQFRLKAGQGVPDKFAEPTDEQKILCVKLAMEETLELADELGVSIDVRSNRCVMYPIQDSDEFSYESVGKVDPVEVLDACCDIFWVSCGGPAVMLGLGDKLEDCLDEVNSSNLSKFIDGHKDPVSGKWIKGKSYTPANIARILNEG